jgi:hypothetical protein
MPILPEGHGSPEGTRESACECGYVSALFTRLVYLAKEEIVGKDPITIKDIRSALSYDFPGRIEEVRNICHVPFVGASSALNELLSYIDLKEITQQDRPLDEDSKDRILVLLVEFQDSFENGLYECNP